MRLLGASLGMVALAAACANAKPATGGRMIRVRAQDFKIEAPAVVPAGDVIISARNLGPDTHELIVARADSADDLPLRPDGITVDEDAIDTAGAIEPFAYGTTEEFSANLDPGTYVFFCNMSGHFLGGMHALVVVR